MPVQRISCLDKEIVLIGTAHVSRQSAEEVKEVIEKEKPSSVCVELCQARYDSIVDSDRWKKMDIIKVIKERKAVLLLVNLVLSSFQGRLARQFGIKPGQEMLQGIESARNVEAELVLADRNIQTTFVRTWRSLGFFNKLKLFFLLILSIFDNEELSEEELEKLKTEDMLTLALSDFSCSFPQLKKVLIDERDMYLAQKIKEAPGPKVVAVVGAGHLPGIMERIAENHDLDELASLPPRSVAGRIAGWLIPLLILGIIVSTFSIDRSVGKEQITLWILWNGSLAAIGTILAFGHPLSVAAAFIAAPITSLNPLLAAGWFAGLSEAYIRRPSVEDFERLPGDIFTLKGFWRNKVTHILLVVAAANLGSVAGTFIGGADVLRLFLKVFES
ncbi:MAG: TraB/GumN family protein [Peptococcaceae bacterium]|jgi:pheromone shutdown-related protein TraB|nr:TraB/GumN family protein [Peptococcaceae bacterium]MDH7526429.1 TraB/GumN family protein [Peptococcaceae bacterium]